MACFEKRKLGNWVFLCVSTELKKKKTHKGIKELHGEEQRKSHSVANVLVEQISSRIVVRNTQRVGHCMKECCFF